MEQIHVIKVGGAVVEDPERLNQLLARFANIKGKKVLVHGGGRAATQMASQLGIETTMVEGRRITDAQMLRVVTMVYAGLVNKQVVASLQALGVNAVGLTGADMNLIVSHRRPVKNGIDYGFVGDVDRADGLALKTLAEAGFTPVVAPLTHDGHGQLLNTNADTMAQTVATALAAHYSVTLVYAFEKAGVLANPDDDSSVIPVITRQNYEQLKQQGIVSGGMVPKIDNALAAISQGVDSVVITSAEAIGDPTRGTTIQA
jgi:acetylglutamate kinase